MGDPPDWGDNVGVPDIPYMGYVKDRSMGNSSSGSRRSYGTLQELLDDVCDEIPVDALKRLELKRELRSFLQAKGVCLIETSYDMGSTTFTITRKNKYFKTEDVFYFPHDYDNSQRVFFDSVTRHYYDGLVNDAHFQNLIKETGLKFLGYSGGYETDYLLIDDKFKLLNKCDVRANFDYDEKRTVSYKINFKDLSFEDSMFFYK